MARKWIGYIGVGSLMCAALGCGILYTRQARLQQAISDKVLRFHVLANSDSEADQNLKLAVRDAVGSFMQEKLTAVENLEECEMVVRQSLGEIEEAAAETIAENGYDYDVTAELEHTSFPVKNYGSYTFPAGDYEALRIVIGEGNGHNWWCVDVYKRQALDELAAKIACEQISEEQLEELVATMHEFEESTKTDNVKKIAEADVKFHDIIYQSTGNPKLVNMLNNLREQMYRYRVEYLKDENNYPTLMKEHKDIVEGLVRKNKMQVTETMHQHVKNQAVAVKAMIQEQE